MGDSGKEESSKNESETQFAKDVTIENGRWVYRDIKSGQKMVYDDSKSEWVAETAVSKDKNMRFNGKEWEFNDPNSGKVMRFSSEKNAWIEKEENDRETVPKDQSEDDKKEVGEEKLEGSEQGDEDDDELKFQLRQQALESQAKSDTSDAARYTDPKDGTVFEYDKEKKGWFPMITDDFLARYQSNYGVTHSQELVEETTKAKQDQKEQVDEKLKKKLEEAAEKKKLAAMTPEDRKSYMKEKKRDKKRLAVERERNRTWFDQNDEHNTSVYVQNLPPDITQETFEQFMSKCGIIAHDAITNKTKAKLYRDPDGNPKGDALCSYIKRESVELALKILDEYDLNGHKISVELAKFELKGSYDPKKKKRRLSSMAKKMHKIRQESLFDWRPEKPAGARPKSDCTVILKNLFTIDEMLDNAARLLELQTFLKAECSKWGDVKKVEVFDNHADGLASVSFAAADEADDCVTMMNYRQLAPCQQLAKRQIRAELWDGKTKFKSKESQDQLQQRDQHWQQFLENDDQPKPQRQKEEKVAATAPNVDGKPQPVTGPTTAKTN